MSNDKVKEFVLKAIKDLIDDATNKKKIDKSIKKHRIKIHFLPIKYRIIGGILQSMNIKFGNFIEKLLEIIIENENNLCINKISRKKNKTLTFTKESDVLIDDYISSCQNYNFCEEDLLKNFKKLINKCFDLEKINTKKEISKKCDIDLLFKNKIDNINYFLELKYNDDHDTDKFININRKLIKTYIGICNYLEIYDLNKFKLILYYMTPKRMKGNIYIPESFNIYRGDRLFKEFFSVKYEELDELMKNISDDPKIISTFDKMYKKIRYDIKL